MKKRMTVAERKTALDRLEGSVNVLLAAFRTEFETLKAERDAAEAECARLLALIEEFDAAWHPKRGTCKVVTECYGSDPSGAEWYRANAAINALSAEARRVSDRERRGAAKAKGKRGGR